MSTAQQGAEPSGRVDGAVADVGGGGFHILSPRTALRRYALISFLTWFPPGLMMASIVLLLSSRGLSLAETGVVMSVHAIVVVVLELPTGGLADVLGRRVILAVSALFSVAGLALLAVATSVWLFVLASVLRGIARALSSGPAQAWYVDMLHAARGPEADLKPGLARGEAMGSVSLCLATLTGGVMPLVLPGGLVTPMIAAAVAAAVLFVVVLVAMPEPPHPRPSIGSVLRDVPVTIGAGLRLGLRDRALSRLLLVSSAIGVGLYSVEVLTPGRLASLTGGAESASSVYALVAAAGFAASGLGHSLAPWAARLLKGSVPAAMTGMVVGAAAFGALAATTVLTGVRGIVAAGAAYVVMFAAVGVAELLRAEMMHRRVGSSRRATLVSMDSLQLQFGGVLGLLVLGFLASRAGTAAAWWAGGAVVLLSALLYIRLPATQADPE